jgi:hypothetical protein
MKITIEIIDIDKTDFFNGFNKAIAKPPEYQQMTDEQFFNQWLIDVCFSAYKTGKIQIASETTQPIIKDGIVSVKTQ